MHRPTRRGGARDGSCDGNPPTEGPRMRALVTGASGFLGSHICDDLASRGVEVLGFDLVPSPWGHDTEIFLGDVRDADALKEAMSGCSVVFNCAGVADLDSARANPRWAIEVNVLGTLAVLEAASAVGASRLLQASSVYVYSSGGSVYRTTKRAAESLIEDLSPDMALKSTILRFGSLYGPRADPGNAILRLVTQAVREGRIDFWGDGTEVREYIHIQDAARLAVDAMGEEFIGQSLHISGHERLTTAELLETMNEILGGALRISYRDEPFEGRYRLTPYAYRDGVGRRMVGSTYVDLGVGLLEAIRNVDRVNEMTEE
jgi:UDP-glucose 4-epimerase